MDPVTLGLLGAGLVLKGIGQFKANQDAAAAARDNASFYREQAAFAEKTGERHRMLFDRESTILFGEQKSAFVKAGVDTQSSSMSLASTMLFRQQESFAIKQESDLNVRLAMLRAEHSDKEAEAASNPLTNFLGIAGPALQTVGMISGGGK